MLLREVNDVHYLLVVTFWVIVITPTSRFDDDIRYRVAEGSGYSNYDTSATVK